MTSTRTMFPPFLAVGEPIPSPTWLLLVLSLGGAIFGTLGTLGVALFNNRHARRTRQVEGEANVEIASIRSLGDVQTILTNMNSTLQGRITEVQIRADKQVGRLDRKLQLMTTAYHSLWGEHKARQQNWRTLTTRLKGTPFQIDPAEFAESDPNTLLSPIKLLELMDKIDHEVNVTIFPSPSDPSRVTTVTERSNGTVEIT